MINCVLFKVLYRLVDTPYFLVITIAIFLLDKTFKYTRFWKLFIKSLLFFHVHLNEFCCIVHLLESQMLFFSLCVWRWFWNPFRLNFLHMFIHFLKCFSRFIDVLFCFFWITILVVFNNRDNILFKKWFYFLVNLRIVFLNLMDTQRVNFIFKVQ